MPADSLGDASGGEGAPGWIAGGAAALARGAARLWQRHPLEATVVLALAVGGLILPSSAWPAGLALWLLGAAAGLLSRLWSSRDKWIGLLGPVLLLIVGTGIVLTAGGRHRQPADYGHEALAGASILIRLGLVLGAGYLAWRTQRGSPPPPVPPWNRRRLR